MVNQKKQQQLDEIRQRIIDDKVTPHLAEQATHPVFGEGNPDADIVFIGEAPGKNEDLLGRPFVGAAGKFLDEMLAMIKLKREDIYITNIVKYRPPGNRDPLPDEKAAFLPYLEAQLEVIAPKLTVTLGRHSLNCFLPDLSISAVHGQPKRIRIKKKELRIKDDESQAGGQDELVLVILPLFHPAAALYSGGMRQTLIDDFVKIPIILRKISQEERA